MPESRKVWQTGSSEMPPPFWNVLPQGTSLLPTIISGNRLLFCRHQNSGSVHGYSETRSRSNVWKERTAHLKDTDLIKLTFSCKFCVYSLHDDFDDVWGLKWPIKCPKNFRDRGLFGHYPPGKTVTQNVLKSVSLQSVEAGHMTEQKKRACHTPWQRHCLQRWDFRHFKR